MDEKQIKKDENVRLKIFVRVMCNIVVITILIGSGYIIYYIVRRSEKFLKNGMENFSWWERNEVRILYVSFGMWIFFCFSVCMTTSHCV